MPKRVLVVGGGTAGLSAALELARRGVPSTVVERSPLLGGKANELACKAAPRCVRCDACYPRSLVNAVREQSLITSLLNAEVAEVEHHESGLRVTVRTDQGTIWVKVGGMIIATGALPFDARDDPRLQYGVCPDVLSADDVERELVRTGGLKVPSSGYSPLSMAIVQCVGSRDVSRGRLYCSKVCCKYAFRLGKHLRSLYPDLRLTFFYMDWRPLDNGDALEKWAEEDGNVRVVRSRPSEVIPGPRPIIRYTSPGESAVEEEYDLIMLSVGLIPCRLNGGLEELEGVGRDENGFLVSYAHRILLAGACSGPKDLWESAEEGVAAAGIVARRVGGRE